MLFNENGEFLESLDKLHVYFFVNYQFEHSAEFLLSLLPGWEKETDRYNTVMSYGGCEDGRGGGGYNR